MKLTTTWTECCVQPKCVIPTENQKPMNKFEQYNEAKKNLDAVRRSITQEDVITLFREYLGKNPHILGIAWTQHTPSFNDGDPCTFRVSDFVGFDREGLLEFGEENQLDPALLDSDPESYLRQCGLKSIAWGECASPKQGGEGWIHVDDGIMEETFGDGTLVVLTRDLMITEEYWQ